MRRFAPYRSAVSPFAALAATLLAVSAPVVLAQSASGSTSTTTATSDTAASTAPVRVAPLPADARFDQKVDFRTGSAGESLDTMIKALAQSVGLSAITQGIPEDLIVHYDLREPKPFRDVWSVVLSLNGLDYTLRDNNIVVVGPPDVLSSLRPQVRTGAATVLRNYSVSNNATKLKELLDSQFPTGSGVDITAFDDLSLIAVRGKPAQQKQIAATLAQFDHKGAVSVRRAYKLSYATATELADVLSNAVTAPTTDSTGALSTAQQPTQVGAGNAVRQALTDSLTSTGTGTAADSAGGAQSAALVAEGQFSIAADDRSNTVVVTAPINVQRDIEVLIAELDKPERQVNVQVRIQEVKNSFTQNLGIDLTSAFGNFQSSLINNATDNGLSFIFDGQKAISGFNIGAMLDTYETQGLSKRVDDSNITVMNNGVASIQSGGTFYISIAGNGSVQNIERTIEYGVQLDIVPQITNDNKVILKVQGSVDVPVGTPDNPAFLHLTSRKINSLVTLGKNQTVVLGGMLQNQSSDDQSGLPIVSDVPVVGSLFKKNVKNSDSTQLLVIVTADIIRPPAKVA